MESYIEVTFLTNGFIILLSVQIAQYITLRPVDTKNSICYALLISLFSVMLWEKWSVYMLITLELLFCLTLFKYAIKTWIFAYLYRWLLMLTCFVVWQGSFHNLTWFVPIHRPFLYIWIGCSFTFLLLYKKWNLWVAKRSCLYTIYVLTSLGWKKMKGYLDSGNLLQENGLPVLFLHKKYGSVFKDKDIHYIQMEGISYSNTIETIQTQVYLAGCQKHEVYICLQQEIRLPMHAQVLLNMNLMMMG